MIIQPVKFIMKQYTFTAIDFETATPEWNSACAIGLVRVEEGIITERYHSLIKPDPCVFNFFNVKIHGITREDVEDAPTFDKVFKEIRPWVKDQIVVAHNAVFEERVINALFEQYGITCYPENYVCTLYHARATYHQLKKHTLPFVYESLFNDKINHHDPLQDAYACAKIELAILNKWQPPTLAGMADALYVDGSNFITNKKKKKAFKLKDISQEEEYDGVRLLKGNSFAFSGSPTPRSKESAAQLIVNLGGVVTAGVTKSTTHLICGEMPAGYDSNHISGKMQKAIDMKRKGKAIEIINATMFGKLVDLWMERLAEL